MEYYTAVVKLHDSEQVTHLSVMTLHLLSFRQKLAAANEVWSNLTALLNQQEGYDPINQDGTPTCDRESSQEFQAVQIMEKK